AVERLSIGGRHPVPFAFYVVPPFRDRRGIVPTEILPVLHREPPFGGTSDLGDGGKYRRRRIENVLCEPRIAMRAGDIAANGLEQEDAIRLQSIMDHLHVARVVAPADMLEHAERDCAIECVADRKSTRLNSSHVKISYAVFCL